MHINWRPTYLNKKRRSALLIGAYGGEHIGDAAILGGILLRLAQRERIEYTEAASYQPGRTRRLVSLIESPVPLKVVPFRLTSIRKHLMKSDLRLARWPDR